MITSLVFLDPKFTFWTLLEFLAFHKFYKSFIVSIMSVTNLKLLACHIFVPLGPAVQTILFFTLKTLKSGIVIFLIEKHIFAICCRTPRDRIAMHICIMFQSMFLVFLIQLRSQNLFNIKIFNLQITFIIWAFQWKSILTDFLFEVLRQAIFMKNMLASLKGQKLFVIESYIAYLA